MAEHQKITKGLRDEKRQRDERNTETTSEPKRSALLITDNCYSDDLTQKIAETKEVKWETLELENATELVSKLEKKKNSKKLKNYQSIILLIGAKDISIEGLTYEEVTKSLKTIIGILKGNPNQKIYVCDIPPVRPDKDLIPFSNLNFEIEEIAKTYEVGHIKLEDHFKLPKSKILEPNSNRLSDKGVEICVKALTSVEVPELQEQKEESEDDDTDIEEETNIKRSIIPMSDETIKHVIGIQGKNIDEMEESTDTNIQKIRWKELQDNKQGFLIVGKKDNIIKAKKLILKTSELTKPLENQRGRKTEYQPRKRRDILCRYYQMPSGCSNGNYCEFAHTEKPSKRGRKN